MKFIYFLLTFLLISSLKAVKFEILEKTSYAIIKKASLPFSRNYSTQVTNDFMISHRIFLNSWKLLDSEYLSVKEDKGFTQTKARISHPFLNVTLGIPPKFNWIDTQIAISSHYKAPLPFSFWVPHSLESLYKSILIKNGLTYSGNIQSVCLDLNNYSNSVNTGNIGIRISNRVEMEAWCKPITNAFNFSNEVSNYFLNIFLSTMNKPECNHYCYFVEGQPVSSVSTFILDEGVGIFNLGTMSNYRNRGYASKILLYAISEAKKRGALFVAGQAAPASQNLLKRIGFNSNGSYSIYTLSKNSR